MISLKFRTQPHVQPVEKEDAVSWFQACLVCWTSCREGEREQKSLHNTSLDNKKLDQTETDFIYVKTVTISNRSFYLTGDDRVDPHWSVASQGEAKTHVAFTYSDGPKNTYLKEIQ